MNSNKRKNPQISLRALCVYAMLGAMIFALKMVMAPLPNIEPSTLLILLCGMIFPVSGICIPLVYVFCELLAFGLGPWSVSYIYIWPLVCCIGFVFRSVRSAWFWALISSLCGFFFGALCALAMIPISGFTGALAWWQAGAWFDLIHGFSNFVLMLLAYHPLYSALRQIVPADLQNDTKKQQS